MTSRPFQPIHYSERVITKEYGGLEKKPMESTFLAESVVKLSQRNTSAEAMLETSLGVIARLRRSHDMASIANPPISEKLSPEDVPYGYCKCGCGRKTNIANKTDSSGRSDRVRGEPMRYFPGHTKRSVINDHEHLINGTVRVKIGHEFSTIVDESDWPKLSHFRWTVKISKNNKFYAVTNNTIVPRIPKKLKMHRVILDSSDGNFVDHVDGDGLNNIRENLRFATEQQNGWNKKRKIRSNILFKGVDRVELATGKIRWLACIRINSKKKNLGRYATAEEAACAYDDAAREFFGEFASLNFPREGETLA